MTRPTTRFVPVKTAERQGALVDHKTRDFLVRQQTQLLNTIRAHLAEFGLVHARDIHNADRLPASIAEAPEAARPALIFWRSSSARPATGSMRSPIGLRRPGR